MWFMFCLPLTREVDFCEAKRRRERKRKTTPQSAAADSSPDKGSRQRLTTHLWVAGRPIKSALVRRQYRIGLCPKMKYPPLCGGIIFGYFLLRKIHERNKSRFIAIKNNTKMIKVKMGLCGAKVANNIIGKPKTMAGKFWYTILSAAGV